MSNKFFKFRKGFSIIELIIVLFIIVTMTGVLMVNQNSNRNQKDVETASRKVAAQLRSMQNEAITGKQIGGTPVSKFNFTALGSTLYSIGYYSSSGDALFSDSFDVNASKSVKALIKPVPMIIQFSSPRGDLSMLGTTKQVILTSIKDANVMASVCVCANGNIFEKKDTAACGC